MFDQSGELGASLVARTAFFCWSLSWSRLAPPNISPITICDYGASFVDESGRQLPPVLGSGLN